MCAGCPSPWSRALFTLLVSVWLSGVAVATQDAPKVPDEGDFPGQSAIPKSDVRAKRERSGRRSKSTANTPAAERMRHPYRDSLVHEGKVGPSSVWTVDAHTASMEIRNSSAETLVIQLNGVDYVRLDPGAHCRIEGLSAGTYEARALDASSLASIATERIVLQRGTSLIWVVSGVRGLDGGTPVLMVENDRAMPLELVVNGVPRIWLAPGESTRLTGIKEGTLRLQARTRQGGVVFDETSRVRRGEEKKWRIGGSSAGLCDIAAVNRRKEPIDVCIGEGPCRRLAPHARTILEEVPATTQHFEVRDLQSNRPIDAFVSDLDPGKHYEWVIE